MDCYPIRPIADVCKMIFDCI